MSLPSWERGLKSQKKSGNFSDDDVAPFVGAWIEIAGNIRYCHGSPRRSLRGSVD